LTLAELAAEFDITQAHAGGAIVDVTKLDSLQAAEIRKRFLEQPVAPDLLALVQQDLRDALSPYSYPHSSSPSSSSASASASASASSSVVGREAVVDWHWEAVVEWDRVTDGDYIALVMKVAHERISRRHHLARDHLYFWSYFFFSHFLALISACLCVCVRARVCVRVCVCVYVLYIL
jgi:hypothetical protein